jgi:ABC-type phosphate transport system substrate-binding protein
VNDRESISVEDLKNALEEAISKGLQLAIFNSCDGLGLAYQLIALNLPQCIVMREPVPDEVAIEFIKYFFKELTQRKSLFLSVLKAKKRLEHFNFKYPGANWLPTLCLKPSIVPFIWPSVKITSEKIVNLPDEKRSSLVPLLAQIKIAKSSLLTALPNFILGFVLGIGSFWLASQISSTAKLPVSLQKTDFSSVNSVKGNWRYGGSTTWAPIRSKIDTKIQQQNPEFKLSYTQHPTLPEGSGTGIQMLLKNQLSFAQSSRPLRNSEFDEAAMQKIALRQVPVAIDGIAIAVNPDLQIKGLTLEELRDIYIGKLTNWQQLGGENLPIIPYSRPLNSGTTEFFKENVLNQRAFTPKVVEIKTTTEALRAVSKNRGAIYYASAAEVVGQCSVKPIPISYRLGSALITPYQGSYISPKDCSLENRNILNYSAFQNSEYPITRKLFVIIRQDGEIEEKAGETYSNLLLTDEGQNLIRDAGFVPLRSGNFQD